MSQDMMGFWRWQWHHLDHRTNNLHLGQITTPTPHHSILEAGCSSRRPNNGVKAVDLTKLAKLISFRFSQSLCAHQRRKNTLQFHIRHKTNVNPIHTLLGPEQTCRKKRTVNRSFACHRQVRSLLFRSVL